MHRWRYLELTTTSTKQKKQNSLKPGEILAYTGTQEEDLAILKWYFELIALNELEVFTTENTHTPFAFLQMLQQPNVFLYTVDGSFSIIHVALFIPFLSGACVSVWTSPSSRGSKGHIIFAQKTLEASLKTWPVIVAITKHDHLADLFEKAGFIWLERIDYLIDGEAANLLSITKEGYEQADFSSLGGD